MASFGTTSTRPSLFNTSTQQPQQTNASSLFGASNAPQQQNQTVQPTPSTGLFGSSFQPQQQPTGIFAPTITLQQPSGVFAPVTTLFQPQQSQQQPTLFPGSGNGVQNQQSLAGNSFGPPQQQSLFGAPQQQTSIRPTGQPQWQPGSTLAPREKTIPEQMYMVLEKWSPSSFNCALQTYFYNSVPPEAVPYYGPGAGEDERKWEEALSKKPTEGSIPVLCRGFAELGNRLRVEVQVVAALQSRLHEINNSLTAMLQTHDLEISVRAVDAKRRHAALSQRCLQLATKVQILRNRGYAMDSTEENLKKKLMELEKNAFDPAFGGRQEEIWARMVQVRERARFLQEEAEKAGGHITNSQSDVLDEDVVRKTKKILSDYDAQISHLKRELEDIRKEMAEWESSKAQ